MRILCIISFEAAMTPTYQVIIPQGTYLLTTTLNLARAKKLRTLSFLLFWLVLDYRDDLVKKSSPIIYLLYYYHKIINPNNRGMEGLR